MQKRMRPTFILQWGFHQDEAIVHADAANDLRLKIKMAKLANGGSEESGSVLELHHH